MLPGRKRRIKGGVEEHGIKIRTRRRFHDDDILLGDASVVVA
jgi:hypothetical protein